MARLEMSVAYLTCSLYKQQRILERTGLRDVAEWMSGGGDWELENKFKMALVTFKLQMTRNWGYVSEIVEL